MGLVASSRRPRPASGRAGRRQRPSRGQGLVEFALVIFPLFLIILGIVQFGFIFNTYVTMTSAAREGARSGTIYLYNQSLSKDQNDLARNNAIKTSVTNAMNMLSKTAPQFTTGSTWSQSGSTYTNGDLTVTYTVPSGVTDSDPRTGEQITVTATYHQDLIVPLIANFLPRDANGRLGLQGAVTMVVN